MPFVRGGRLCTPLYHGDYRIPQQDFDCLGIDGEEALLTSDST